MAVGDGDVFAASKSLMSCRAVRPVGGNSTLAEVPVEALQALLEKDGAYLGRDVN